jgi:glucose-6-phosphate 1-dehydrogenase
MSSDFSKAFGGHTPEAYERLMDVICGNATLFMRRDEVEAAWTFIDPIRQAWSESKEPPRPYVAGSWGPRPQSPLSNAMVGRGSRTVNGRSEARKVAGAQSLRTSETLRSEKFTQET